MPAKSEKQRKMMHVALALKQGKRNPKDVGGAAKEAAASMTAAQLKDFTRAKGRKGRS